VRSERAASSKKAPPADKSAFAIVAAPSGFSCAGGRHRTNEFLQLGRLIGRATVARGLRKKTGYQGELDTLIPNDLLETKLLPQNAGYDRVVQTAYFLRAQIKGGRVFRRLDNEGFRTSVNGLGTRLREGSPPTKSRKTNTRQLHVGHDPASATDVGKGEGECTDPAGLDRQLGGRCSNRENISQVQREVRVYMLHAFPTTGGRRRCTFI